MRNLTINHLVSCQG